MSYSSSTTPVSGKVPLGLAGGLALSKSSGQGFNVQAWWFIYIHK